MEPLVLTADLLERYFRSQGQRSLAAGVVVCMISPERVDDVDGLQIAALGYHMHRAIQELAPDAIEVKLALLYGRIQRRMGGLS